MSGTFGLKQETEAKKESEKPAACIQRVSCRSHAADTTHVRRNPAHTMAAFHAVHRDCRRQRVSYSRL